MFTQENWAFAHSRSDMRHQPYYVRNGFNECKLIFINVPYLTLVFSISLQLMLDSWNQHIFSNIKQRLQDSAMKLVLAERNGEAFEKQLVIGVRESYGKKISIKNQLQLTSKNEKKKPKKIEVMYDFVCSFYLSKYCKYVHIFSRNYFST